MVTGDRSERARELAPILGSDFSDSRYVDSVSKSAGPVLLYSRRTTRLPHPAIISWISWPTELLGRQRTFR